MSLKNEIDKLIATERARLEQKDDWHREGEELAKTRFGLFRSALEEVIKAVDPAYLRVEFSADHNRATIKVGQHQNNSIRIDGQWEIESRRSDFWVEKEYRPPGDLPPSHSFNTESETIQHILKEMRDFKGSDPFVSLARSAGSSGTASLPCAGG